MLKSFNSEATSFDKDLQVFKSTTFPKVIKSLLKQSHRKQRILLHKALQSTKETTKLYYAEESIF